MTIEELKSLAKEKSGEEWEKIADWTRYRGVDASALISFGARMYAIAVAEREVVSGVSRPADHSGESGEGV